jgi:NADPH-dependent 2,4-dienoyl-CoA reductase/sulfur reductase-like enzyme
VRRQWLAEAGRQETLPPATIADIPVERPEVLVVGAGPGGLAAAIAARRCGAEVLVLDERRQPGGQFFKQLAGDAGPPPDRQHEEGRRLIDEAAACGVTIRSDALVWGAFQPLELAATAGGGTIRLLPQRLIVATGAYERAVPFPGWTLPGVMTTGAAQTLWRTDRRLPGRRVLVAGNGPLNLQVAAELADGGAEIAAVIEAASPPSLRHAAAVAAMAMTAPRLLADGLRYRARLRSAGVPVIHASVVDRVEAEAGGLAAHVAPLAGGARQRFSVDVVCLGYGFEPSNELLRALGARHDFDAVRGHLVTRTNEVGGTSIPAVYALGDCTSLGGARIALAAGTLAGTAAAASLGRAHSAEALRARRTALANLARHRRFQAALWTLFAAPRFGLEFTEADTIVCRCEEVTRAALSEALAEGFVTAGNVKRRTRAGMGRCQGRYCAPLIGKLVSQRCGLPQDEFSGFAPRVPVKPVTIAELAGGAF